MLAFDWDHFLDFADASLSSQPDSPRSRQNSCHAGSS